MDQPKREDLGTVTGIPQYPVPSDYHTGSFPLTAPPNSPRALSQIFGLLVISTAPRVRLSGEISVCEVKIEGNITKATWRKPGLAQERKI